MPVGRKTDTVHTREEALVGDPMSAPQSSVSASPSIKWDITTSHPSSVLGMNSPLVGGGGGGVVGACGKGSGSREDQGLGPCSVGY